MSEINKNSRDWQIISQWAVGELKKYRDANEVPGTDLPLTESHRASIMVLKELLALPDSGTRSQTTKGATDYGIGTKI